MTNLVSREVPRYQRDRYDHPSAAWDQPRSSDLEWEVTEGHVVAVAALVQVRCGVSDMEFDLGDNPVLGRLERMACSRIGVCWLQEVQVYDKLSYQHEDRHSRRELS